MRAFKNILFILFFVFCCIPLGFAQILDDEDASGEDEELFNEMFSDYSETEKDVTKVKNFGDIIDRASDVLKQADTSLAEEDDDEEPLAPIEGDLFIGVTKGSFKTFADIRGKTACSFNITLKSTLNYDIKTMGLYLVYPKRSFAFMFFDVKANSSQEKTIRTSGDICYNMAGAPDIDIHKCKIYGASNRECSNRIKWNENLSAE